MNSVSGTIEIIEYDEDAIHERLVGDPGKVKITDQNGKSWNVLITSCTFDVSTGIANFEFDTLE